MPVNIPFFLLRGVVWFFVPLIVGILIFHKNEDYKEMVKYLKNIINIIFSKFKKKKKNTEGEQQWKKRLLPV